MELAKLIDRLSAFDDSFISVRRAGEGMQQKSYADFREDIERAVVFLGALGLRKGFRVGIYAENSYEWMVLDLACIKLGIFVVAFSDETFRASESAEIFRHYGLAVLFTEKAPGGAASHAVIDLGKILREGAPQRIAEDAGSPQPVADDHFTLSFSSGSTGLPKGIIVSRAGTEFLLTAFLRSFGISSADRIFIFLPLSNFQQRLLVYASLYRGADIAVTPHDCIFQDLKLCAPSFFVAPPVLYKNILKLFSLQREGGDSLPALLGGNIRFALVGMAAIEPQVIQEFHDNGVLLLETYGLTESGVVSWNTPDNFRIGTVGMPLDVREIEFSDVQELLIRRRAPLCLGYFDDDEGGSDTQTFRKGGVIATGDLACMDAAGYLVLTGRKKNVVVTASGHKYQPEVVEKRINLIPFVCSSVVYHSTTRQCNVAIINMDGRLDAGALAGLQAGIDSLNATLPDYQRIAKILANNDPYTVENKLLTGNLKLNRNNIIEKYALPG